MGIESPILCSNKYKMTPHTKSELINLKFVPIGKNNDQLYIYKFPVWKYNDITTIEGSILVDGVGNVYDFKVYDLATHEFYRPFYHYTERYAYAKRFITGMENAIKYAFHRVGIEDDI